MFALGSPALAVGLLAAGIPILWFSPHWGLHLLNCHTVLTYICDFYIPRKLWTRLYEYRVSSNPIPANGWGYIHCRDGVQKP